jgi:hypothetical protein
VRASTGFFPRRLATVADPSVDTARAEDDAWIARLEQTFPPDALERLTRAEYDYYSTHGDYLPGLAKLALTYLEQRDMLSHRADWVHPDDHAAALASRASSPDGRLEELREAAQEFIRYSTASLPADPYSLRGQALARLRAALAARAEGEAVSERRYDSACELASAMVTAWVHENRDWTVFLHFENEHAEYGVTITHEEARDLCAHIGAAASSAKFNERVAEPSS